MFNIDDTAIKKITSTRDKENNSNMAFKITVEGGGCSGFKYLYDFVNNWQDWQNAEYEIFEKDNAKVIIDKYSLENFLQNSTLIFIDELGNKHFDIKNPNSSAKCGCGISFAV